MMKRALSIATVGLAAVFGLAAAGSGIQIDPGEEGVFDYADDFGTPKVFRDAITENLDTECWSPGSIVSSGPHGARTIIYRFYGSRPVKSFDVRVEQVANGRSLGGRNTLFLSDNGLDWQQAATSSGLEPNPAGWQEGPLTATWEAGRANEQKGAEPVFAGGAELWVRIVLTNHSGLKTNTSNRVTSLTVRITQDDEAKSNVSTDGDAEAAWGRLRKAAQWRALVMDLTEAESPPHYVEAADGWLEQALQTDPSGLVIARRYSQDECPQLALAAFVAMDESLGPVMAKVTVASRRDSHRELEVLWDGEPVAVLDAACFFERDKSFHVTMPAPQAQGVHELRIQGRDAGRSAVIRRIEMAGPGVTGWHPKPSLPQGGSLEILAGYYIPDPPPPPASQAVEGRRTKGDGLVFRGMQRLYDEHASFGAIRVLYKNVSDVPVRLAPGLVLNDRPVEASYVDFTDSDWDAPGVVWYRVRPRTLTPGQTGQAYIRFRRRPEGDYANVTLAGENVDPVTVTVPYTDPSVLVDYVTTGRNHDTLYVYVRRTDSTAQLARVELDGVVLEDATLYGADFPGGVALAVAEFPKPLVVGDYHVVAIETEDGRKVAAQFRVLPFEFPRSSIHVPADLAQPMHMNLLTWRMHGLETCQALGLSTTCMDSMVLHTHPLVRYIFAPDEPDAKDNRGGGYDRGLGWHARMLEESRWQELVERRSPPLISWMNINGTVRPLNWAVYGQFGDVNGFDPYPVTYYGGDHAFVRESLDHVRLCGAPGRLYAILEAYGWSVGQGVPKDVRGPIPAEYRQNAVQAIGAGIKGLTSWVHSGSAGGWQNDEPVSEEITRVNRLIEHIETDLLIGTPIDLARSDAGTVLTGVVGKEAWPKERVWVGGLLCGPDTIVLVAANHIPASRPDPPTISPAENVTITVQLPDFLHGVTASEVTEGGLQPYPSRVENGQALLQVDRIESGRVFVLRRSSPS